MKVLITGGTGFIGSRLALACRQRGDSVRILSQTNTSIEQQNLEELKEQSIDVIIGSVSDKRVVARAVKDIEVVFHMAAAQHETGMSNEYFHHVNVDGTRSLLSSSVDAGVSRFVHGSTIGVYQADRGTVRDDSATIPDNIYGATKLKAEEVVRSYQDRIPWVIMRISETYGPSDRRLLKLFKGIEKRRFTHIGRGANLHHPVYVDDLIEAVLLAAKVDAAVGQTMVIPGFEVVTSRQMVGAIAEVLGLPSPKWTVPLAPMWAVAVVMEWVLRPFGINPPLHRRRMHFFIKSFEFVGSEARLILGYEPKVSFADGARRTADWYREQGLL